MYRIKCATFDKEMQDNIPQEIREKMKADRVKAEKEQKTKAKTLPIQNVSKSALCENCEDGDILPKGCICEECGRVNFA